MSKQLEFEEMFTLNLNQLVDVYFARGSHQIVAGYRAILLLRESVHNGVLSKVDVAFTVYFFALFNIRNKNKTHVSVVDVQNLATQILDTLENYAYIKDTLMQTHVYETLQILQSKDCKFLLEHMVEEERLQPGGMLNTLKENMGVSEIKQFVKR
jgi:hypothetical protein